MVAIVGRVIAVGFLLAILLASAPARATEAVVNVAVEGSFSRGGPSSLSLNGDDVSRRYVGAGVKSAQTFYGVGAALHVSIYEPSPRRGDPPDPLAWYLALGSLRIASSADSASQTETAGGAPVTVTRDAVKILEVGFPVVGFGALVLRGHFLLRAGIDEGWTFLWTAATVRSASSTLASGSVDAGSFYLRTPISACLLGQPFHGGGDTFRDGQDICLTVTPTVYEWQLFHGWSAGVRVDF